MHFEVQTDILYECIFQTPSVNIRRDSLRYMLIICCRLLMDSVRSQLGVFEGYPGRQVFSHNIQLLKTAQYKLAGQFITWSVANGGPGIACLSAHTYNALLGQCVTEPHEAVNDVPDADLKDVVLEVGRHFALCSFCADVNFLVNVCCCSRR